MEIASKIGCGAIEVRLAPGGRAKLFTTEPCCVLVNEEVLNQINSRPGMVVATARNFTWAGQGIQIAVVKSSPFVVPKTDFEILMSFVQERGPILEARPIRSPTVAVLYTDPVDGKRARQLFENSTRNNPFPQASAEHHTNGCPDRLDHCTCGSGRRHRPSLGASGMRDRVLLGASGARLSALARLYGPCSNRVRTRLLPPSQTERRGQATAADASRLPCFEVGARRPGAWGLARLTSYPSQSSRSAFVVGIIRNAELHWIDVARVMA